MALTRGAWGQGAGRLAVGLSSIVAAVSCSAAGTATPGTTSSALPTVPAVVSVTLPAPTYDLAYDPGRDALWFTIMWGGKGAIYEYGLGSRTTTHWDLPPTNHNGFLERVAVAPDGSVWATEDYSVVRLDPATGRLKTRPFALADPAASPGAATGEGPSPGTWPSSIAFDTNGDAMIGRHNVAALTVLDANLDQIGRLAIPALAGGPSDLAATATAIVIAPYGSGAMAVLDRSGGLVAEGPGDVVRLASDGSKVVAVGGAGVSVIGSTGSVSATAVRMGADLVASRGNVIAVYLQALSSIDLLAGDGSMVASTVISSSTVVVTNPIGGTTTGSEVEQLSGLAIDGAGHVWAATTSHPALVQVRF